MILLLPQQRETGSVAILGSAVFGSGKSFGRHSAGGSQLLSQALNLISMKSFKARAERKLSYLVIDVRSQTPKELRLRETVDRREASLVTYQIRQGKVVQVSYPQHAGSNAKARLG